MNSPISDFVQKIAPHVSGQFSDTEIWDEVRVSPLENVDISCTLAFKVKSDRSAVLGGWQKSVNLQGLQVEASYLNWNLTNEQLLEYAKALSDKALGVESVSCHQGDREAFLNYFSHVDERGLSDKIYENPLFSLKYAYAQTCALKRMKQEMDLSVENLDEKLHLSPEERALLVQAVCMSDELIRLGFRADKQAFLKLLCAFAKKFHLWYNTTRILDENDLPVTKTRLLIVESVQNALKLVFKEIQISAPEKL